MNNKIKKINLLGIVALFMAGSLALAFNAPFDRSSDTSLIEYGMLADGTWEEVGLKTPGTNPGQFSCESSNKVCRAYFDHAPEKNEEPRPEDIIQDNGLYVIN